LFSLNRQGRQGSRRNTGELDHDGTAGTTTEEDLEPLMNANERRWDLSASIGGFSVPAFPLGVLGDLVS
jgi:hypothetical protein